MENIKLVESHIIKPNNELWKFVDSLCWKTRCLRNKANFIVRKNFFSKKNHKYLNYNFIDKLFKNHSSLEEIYRLVPRATIAQQCLRMLDKEWKSFFKAIKSYSRNKSGFTGVPKPPKYKKDKQTYTAILLPQEFTVIGKCLTLPKYLNNYKIHFHNSGKLKQVRIVPCSNRIYKIELVFDQIAPKLLDKKDRFLAIDLGVSNLATIVTNTGTKPVLLNGKDLKSVNQYYNKKISSCKSILPKHKNGKQQSTSKLIEKLHTNRNNKIKSRMHRYSRFIVDYARSNNIDTIIIGYNKEWKQESDLGKKNNQNFQQIPFSMLIQQIEYKAKLYGIEVVRLEESYTSGTSFLDKEIPDKKYYDKSRRVNRGLFNTNNDIKINADVNAAYQILRKYLQMLDKSYAIEGLQDVIFKNLSYALSPNRVTVNSNTKINKLY